MQRPGGIHVGGLNVGGGNPMDAVKHAVQGGVNQVQHAAQGGVQQVEHAADGCVQHVQHVGQQAVQQVEHAAETAVQQALQELSKPVVKAALKEGARLTRSTKREIERVLEAATGEDKATLEEQSKAVLLYVEIKAGAPSVSLYFKDWLGRADAIAAALDHYGDIGIRLTRSGIREFFEACGPDAFDFSAGIEVELILGTKAQFAVWGIPAALAYGIMDTTLREMGVPA